MTPEQSIRSYRQMYLFTLGCSGFVDHSDAALAARRKRTALAGLDRHEFPALTHDVELIVDGVSNDAVFREGLRNLIIAAKLKLPRRRRRVGCTDRRTSKVGPTFPVDPT